MKPVVAMCRVENNVELRKNLFDITVKNVELAKLCKAGQFLHIKCGEEVYLRRPISICDVQNEYIRFIIEVRGKGTDWLSKVKEGETLDILGPLGNGFTDIDFNKKVVFVGGGIGIFPLLMHAKKYGKNATVLLGFRDKENVVLEDEFKNFGCDVRVSTDDGSYGYKGFVTKFLEQRVEEGGCEAVFACGPQAMLKKTADIANKNNIFCEISMEERMGCGVGACLVCACKTIKGDSFTYSHICKDGPTFNAKEIIF